MLILSDLSPEDKKLFDTPLGVHHAYLRQKLLVPGQVEINDIYNCLLTKLSFLSAGVWGIWHQWNYLWTWTIQVFICSPSFWKVCWCWSSSHIGPIMKFVLAQAYIMLRGQDPQWTWYWSILFWNCETVQNLWWNFFHNFCGLCYCGGNKSKLLCTFIKLLDKPPF